MTNQQRRVHSYERFMSCTILRLHTFTGCLSVEKRFDYTSSLLFSKVSSINVPNVMKNRYVGLRGWRQAVHPHWVRGRQRPRGLRSRRAAFQHHKKKDILFFVNYEFLEN